MADDQIRKIMVGLSIVAEQVIKAVALDVVANLVRAAPEGGTPVDTGWARSNWLINLGSPITTTVGSPDAVTPGPQNQGKVGIALYKLFHGPVWISNNVPYITRLNEGSSKQAPAGFVQRAIAQAVQRVQKIPVVAA